MIEEKTLVRFIAENLDINEIYVSRNTNITTLCVISLYINNKDNYSRNQLQINVNALNKKIENIEHNGRDIRIDITDYFVSPNEKSIIFQDRVGFDGCCDFQIQEDLLILQIEQYLNFPHTDEEIISADFINIGDLVNFYCK